MKKKPDVNGTFVTSKGGLTSKFVSVCFEKKPLNYTSLSMS